MRSRVPLAAVLLATVISACDQRAPTDPARATDVRAAILDGSSGGNPHFFFLPPIVKKTSSNGAFNASLGPTVEICTTTAQTASGACVSLLARFKRFRVAGDGTEPIVVSIKGEKYSFDWDTKRYPAPVEVPFRMVVMVGSIQLGYVDLFRTSSGTFKNFTTGDILNRRVDGTVPMAFRIEDGALCAPGAAECFEGSVGPEGGTFTITRTNGTKPAGTQFPVGALDRTVTLIIERVTGECLPTDAPQYQGCYRFHTEPEVDDFELPATVGVCVLDPAALSYFNSGQLRLWKWSEEPGDQITELERVTIEYLECPTLQSIGMRSNSPLLLGAAKLLKPFASLVLPREAHAFGVYEGGKLINFSRIGWVRPLTVEVKSGDDQTGTAGQALANPVGIRVTNKYGTITEGVAGRAVTFTPSGNGFAAPPATFTNLFGEASTIWTLATTPGANTLLARALTSRPIAPVPYEAEATANATGIQPFQLYWHPTIGLTFTFTGTPVMGQNPVVKVSVVSGGLLQTLSTTEVSTDYQVTWTFPNVPQNTPLRLTVNANGQDVGFVDLVFRDGGLYRVDTNTRVMAIDETITSTRFKFKLLQ
jgi:hypothetical protein